MSYNKPLPKIDTVNKGFWDAARQGTLTVQHCTACNDMHFPPGPVCPNCLSSDQDWQPVSGRGTLQGWVDFHRAYWDGYKNDLPYRVCLVQLDEGPLLISNLVNAPADPKFGAAVKVVFEAVTDEFTLPKFTLA